MSSIRRAACVTGTIALAVCTTLNKHAGERTCTWFEFLTDGGAPDWLTSDAQQVLGDLWTDGFRRRLVDPSLSHGDGVASAMAKFLHTAAHRHVLELAAGQGTAPAEWAQLLDSRFGLDVGVVLTDLQPDVALWRKIRGVSFIPRSIDSTNASAAVRAAVPGWGASTTTRELRMIHLALHHFPPEHAERIMADVVAGDAAVLVADLMPSRSGVLLNGLLTLRYLALRLPGILLRDPLKLLLVPALPIIGFVAVHDATVSVLRAYSDTQLRAMLVAADGGAAYEMRAFHSASYGEWLGLPDWLSSLVPWLRAPVMQFFLALPPAERFSAPSLPPQDARSHATVARTAVHAGLEHGLNFDGAAEASEDAVFTGRWWAQLVLALASAAAAGRTLTRQRGAPNAARGSGEVGAPNAARGSGEVGAPAILGIGTSNPPTEWSVEDYVGELATLEKAGTVSAEWLDFLSKRVRNSGIERRCFALEPRELVSLAVSDVETRHAKWAKWAPQLAVSAARSAIADWGGDKAAITHVVFHSCTGFTAPGIELELIDQLKLPNVVRRLGINFMGCFGGFTGMSVAKTYVQANTGAVVLLVCCEICTSHFSISKNRSEALGNAIFADGAAAAIIGAGQVGDWAISEQATHTLSPSTRDQMTWSPSNHGYLMVLDKAISTSLGTSLFWSVGKYLRAVCGGAAADEVEWCVHPGGRGILDALCDPKYRLGATKVMLRHSYGTLAEHGNMSSCTILFVIKRMIDEQKVALKSTPTPFDQQCPSSPKTPMMRDLVDYVADGNASAEDHVPPLPRLPTRAFCLGFGPGLTVEIAGLHRI